MCQSDHTVKVAERRLFRSGRRQSTVPSRFRRPRSCFDKSGAESLHVGEALVAYGPHSVAKLEGFILLRRDSVSLDNMIHARHTRSSALLRHYHEVR